MEGLERLCALASLLWLSSASLFPYLLLTVYARPCLRCDHHIELVGSCDAASDVTLQGIQLQCHLSMPAVQASVLVSPQLDEELAEKGVEDLKHLANHMSKQVRRTAVCRSAKDDVHVAVMQS